MPGPIDSLRFVHAAILAEADGIEAAAAAATPADVGALRDRVAYFSNLVNLHTKGEEVGLFPKLAERHGQLPAPYLHDHEDERALFAEILELCDACQKDDAAALARLRRQTIALNAHASSHIAKENTLVIPLVGELFSPEEQGAMIQQILSTISPEEMAKAVPFIVSRCNLDMAAAYVGALAGAMPPPVFEKAKGWIADGVDADKVAALKQKVPALA